MALVACLLGSGASGRTAVPGTSGRTAVPGASGRTAVPGASGRTTVPGTSGRTAVPGASGRTWPDQWQDPSFWWPVLSPAGFFFLPKCASHDFWTCILSDLARFGKICVRFGQDFVRCCQIAGRQGGKGVERVLLACCLKGVGFWIAPLLACFFGGVLEGVPPQSHFAC